MKRFKKGTMSFFIAVGLCLGGCHSDSAVRTRHFEELDNSSGIPVELRLAYAGRILNEMPTCPNDRFTIDLFTVEVRNYLDSQPPTSLDRLAFELRRVIEQRIHSRGTLPSKMWLRIASAVDADKAADARFVIEIWSDQDDDSGDEASKQEFKKSVEQLANDPRVVSVTLVGATAENRLESERRLAAFGSRVRILGPGEKP